jgi:hypothetical protein
MGRKIGRHPEEGAAPPELECLAGGMGPYIKSDKAEFHHASKEAQEWFLRLSKQDVALVEASLSLTSLALSVKKWAWRLFWAFTSGLVAVLGAGEKLAKLPETISGALSGLSRAFEMLRGLGGP